MDPTAPVNALVDKIMDVSLAPFQKFATGIDISIFSPIMPGVSITETLSMVVDNIITAIKNLPSKLRKPYEKFIEPAEAAINYQKIWQEVMETMMKYIEQMKQEVMNKIKPKLEMLMQLAEQVKTVFSAAGQKLTGLVDCLKNLVADPATALGVDFDKMKASASKVGVSLPKITADITSKVNEIKDQAIGTAYETASNVYNEATTNYEKLKSRIKKGS